MASRGTNEIRVVVVDDDARVRAAIPPLINAWSGYRVVEAIGSCDELIGTVIREQPDVVLIDLDMPGRSPFHAMEDLRYRGSRCRVLVLSALADEPTVRGSLAAGAHGYVLKEDGPEALREGLETVLSGRLYLSPGIVGTL